MVPSKPKKITANNGGKRTSIIFYEIVYDRILKDTTGTVVSSQCLCITGFRYFSIIIHTTSIIYMCLKIFNVLLVKIKTIITFGNIYTCTYVQTILCQLFDLI